MVRIVPWVNSDRSSKVRNWPLGELMGECLLRIVSGKSVNRQALAPAALSSAVFRSSSHVDSAMLMALSLVDAIASRPKSLK